jgi:hypothetical protein
MEVIMMAAWAIWIHRNNIIFNNAVVCLAHWKHEFREFRAKASLESSMVSWLASL